jgi:type 1 glutamine amidotransferase
MTSISLWISVAVAAACLLFLPSCEKGPKVTTGPISVLLIDGQNNHAWVDTSPVLKAILENSGRFEVTISTSPPAAPRAPRKPKEATPAANEKFASDMKVWETAVKKHKEEIGQKWDDWRPDFASYDVVVSNYNGELWPEPVRQSFEAYVSGGGGFVAVHAANNAFPEWPAYNEMIGVGGWGGRSELSGPYLRKGDDGWGHDTKEGRGGSHGKRHEFVVVTQKPHPIVDGLPEKWLHAEDELYDRLRGPAKDVSVLAAAFAKVDTGGSGEWEPMLMTIPFGEGRVFHTTLGHNTTSMGDIGFAETLKRGTEWAGTGFVTFAPPAEWQMTTEKVVMTEGEALIETVQ